MFARLKHLWERLRSRPDFLELIRYLVIGVATTAINYAVFWLFTLVFPDGLGYLAANAVAWVVSVVFAFFLNRGFVFRARTSGFPALFREMLLFFSARVLSYALFDVGLMYLLVTPLGMHKLIAKLIDNAFVIAFNYAASKWVIFKRR